MSSNLIIVTGGPGSGKTYFAKKLHAEFPTFGLYPYDALKETFFDQYGFDSLEERAKINDKSLVAYYKLLDDLMGKGKDLIIEYPFCHKHEKSLQDLVAKHGYKATSIILSGDFHVLYDRWIKRNDNDVDRHPGHLYNRYHKGMIPDKKDLIPPMDYDEFVRSCQEKDYGIHVGHVIPVDVTDFSKIDWKAIFAQLSF
jgi:adenylate kinase family enzyme